MKRLSLSAFQIFCEAGGLPGFVTDRGCRLRYQSPDLPGKIPRGAVNGGQPGFLRVDDAVYAVIQFPLSDAGLTGAILQMLSGQSPMPQIAHAARRRVMRTEPAVLPLPA